MNAVTDPALEPWSFEPDPSSAFGPIVSAFEVEHALARCVRRWIRDYLGEVARQRGLEPRTLPAYRSIVVSGDTEKMPEDQTPVLVIASKGLQSGGRARAVQVHGDGSHDGRLEVECASFVAAAGNREALRNARLYTAAIRALCLQQALEPQGGLELRRVEWTGERFDRLRTVNDRTVALGVAILTVEVAAMTYWQAGPTSPMWEPTPAPQDEDELEEPPPERELPRAMSTHITIRKEAL